jgi:hypothetical protein
MSNLKQWLKSQNFPDNKGKSNVRRVIGFYPERPHTFIVSPTPNGKAGIVIEFPPIPKTVEDIELFCEILNDELLSGATLSFNDVENRFFLYFVTDFDGLDQYLCALACDCDNLIPLCKNVGEQGCWDYKLIFMSLNMPEDMHRRPQ